MAQTPPAISSSLQRFEQLRAVSNSDRETACGLFALPAAAFAQQIAQHRLLAASKTLGMHLVSADLREGYER